MVAMLTEGGLLKYGSSGMVCLLEQLFSVIWCEELVPRQWREGLIVNLFKKGDKEDPGNYMGITLLSVVGKVFCKILNRLVEHLDKGEVLHEGQAGFRVNRSCMDNVFTLNELVQGRLRENNIHTYALFLDVQKAYDTVWRDGLWLKLWVKGRMWHVIKKMYEGSRSAVLLEVNYV